MGVERLCRKNRGFRGCRKIVSRGFHGFKNSEGFHGCRKIV